MAPTTIASSDVPLRELLEQRRLGELARGDAIRQEARSASPSGCVVVRCVR